MADGHVRLTHIVCVAQIGSLAPVEQSQTVEALYSVGSEPATV